MRCVYTREGIHTLRGTAGRGIIGVRVAVGCWTLGAPAAPMLGGLSRGPAPWAAAASLEAADSPLDPGWVETGPL